MLRFPRLVLPTLLLASATLPHHVVQAQRIADSASSFGSFRVRGGDGRIGLMAIGMASHVSPAYAGRDFTEGYLTQPNLMADLRWRRLSLLGTLNGEVYTIDRGELTPGIYGEGYVDRRHPHTLLHEIMLSVSLPGLEASGFTASVSIGKGFAPFGTDDPMMRPLAKYPVNHHHAQILERAQITGAVRYARGDADITLEGGVFNGDEPTGPFATPQLSRLTDSRAARLTVRPRRTVEAQVSAAHVESPDLTQGGAGDHAQRSASIRWDGTLRSARHSYAMIEGARTALVHSPAHSFILTSLLAEAMAGWRLGSVAMRWERTDRPESERLLDPFRSPVGHTHFQLLGITRWNVTTLNVGGPGLTLPRSLGTTRLTPFAEVARSVPSAVVLPTLFEPELFYGARTLWTYSIGVRMHVGSMRTRMGRYGVAIPRATSATAAVHHH